MLSLYIVKLVLETLLIIDTKSFLGLSAHDSSHVLVLISKPAQSLLPLQWLFKQNKLNPRL